MAKQPKLPSQLVIGKACYTQLLALVQWFDATPTCVDLGDRAIDSISDQISVLATPRSLHDDFCVTSVQVETEETAVAGKTEPGQLVALIEVPTAPDVITEVHVPIVTRGARR